MKEIKILNLSLRNFKGIKDFTLLANGSNVNIFGDNATGKTTIMDAFIWLLFDKDSQNSSNFNIKTLDEQGNVIHGLEHEVSVKLEIDGKTIELQKIYKEKWTKKRGEAERTLTGHTTDYFINNVPKKKSEYEDYLSEIIDEETFKTLTSPLYFNTNIPWRDRRNIALSICGEVEDKEVVAQDNKLKDLEALLNHKSIDDLKAEMTARRRKLNEELKSIPYRIDELSREDLQVDVEALNAEKKDLEGRLAELTSEKGVDYDFRINFIKGGIRTLENELKDLEYNAVKVFRENLSNLMKEIEKINTEYYDEKREVRNLALEGDEYLYNTKVSTDRIKALREEWAEVMDKTFDEDTTICPTCHQKFPTEDIELLRKNFNDDKQHRLQKINQDGKRESDNLARSEKSLEKTMKQLEYRKEGLELLEEMLKEKKAERDELEKQIENIDITSLPEYKENLDRIEKLNKDKKELIDLQAKEDKSEDISALQNEIDSINKELAKVELAKDNEKRVLELKTRERELAQMVADTEKTEFLCEQFVIEKSNLLEDKLNSKFSLVKFKLFEKQVNGGINETFVTTVDGVPFEDLNNAMKINSGLDIIKTLSDYYEIQAPIFIDNAESVNELLDMPNQIIRLIVSKHKNLRVEVE